MNVSLRRAIDGTSIDLTLSHDEAEHFYREGWVEVSAEEIDGQSGFGDVKRVRIDVGQG